MKFKIIQSCFQVLHISWRSRTREVRSQQCLVMNRKPRSIIPTTVQSAQLLATNFSSFAVLSRSPPVHQGDRQEDEDMEVPHVGSAVQARLQESPMWGHIRISS
jgi:hypothetical protein